MADPSVADLGTHLVQFAVAIILGINLWLMRTVDAMRKDVQTFNQWAFGIQNSGGVEKRLGALEERMAQFERRHDPS